MWHLERTSREKLAMGYLKTIIRNLGTNGVIMRMNLKEIHTDIVYWMQITQDSVKCQDLNNTVTYLASTICGYFNL
jgi:hypothetical protein